MRALGRLAAWIGWAALAALAATGVSLSVLAAWARLSPSGPVVSALVAREAAAFVAGPVSIEGVAPLARGGFEVRGLALRDPDGHLVLAARRVRIFANVTELPRRLGLTLEVDDPTVILETEADGEVSIARALALPRHAAPGAAPGAPDAAPFALRVTRLTATGGTFRWLRRDGSTALAVDGIALEAEGSWVDPDATLRARLSGEARAPVPGPLAIATSATLRGDRLEVPLLQVAIGGTSLEALGDLDVRTLAFRAAVRRLGLAAADARAVVPARAAPAGDLAATAYGESDGRILGAAVEARTAGDGGSARVAAALRPGELPPQRGDRAGSGAGAPPALGLDLDLARFDPSRLLARAPPGRLDLVLRGAATGRSLAQGKARVALELAPSRLRGVDLGPAALTARADRGDVEVERLEARLPGLALTARGIWRDHGEARGALDLDARDLAAAGRALAAVAGVALPPLAGRGRVHAELSGSSAAPALAARIEGPLLGAGAVRAEQVFLTVDGAGPVATGRLRVKGHAARGEASGAEARALELSATVEGSEAALSVTGTVPSVGSDPISVEGRARLASDRSRGEVHALTVRWPGARFALVRPAAVVFAPLSTERLALADGTRSVALTGGIGRDGAIDARLEVVRLDLGTLPRALVPAGAGLEGELGLDARVRGSLRAPEIAGRVEVANGALRGARGLRLRGDVAWARGRLTADAALAREEGGAAEVSADLPLPVARAAPGEPVSLTVKAASVPLDLVRRLAGGAAALAGTVRGQVTVSGTAGAPRLEASVAVDDAALADLRPLSVEAALREDGAALHLTATARLGDAPLGSLDASAPLSLAAVLRDPHGTLRRLETAPLSGKLEVAGLELAGLAGKAGLPRGLAGRLSGEATLAGTPAAPRGRARLAVQGGALAGYRDVAAEAEVALEPARTAVVLRASIAGGEALRAEGSLGAPIERLGDAATFRSAPLSLDVAVPGIALSHAGAGPLPLEGTIAGHLAARGTLARPEATLDLDAKDLALGGRKVGALVAKLSHSGTTSRVEGSLASAAGGTLRLEGALEAPRGLADPGALRDAEATLRATSDRLDLAFLSALLPGLVRSSAGRLTLDLAASGPVKALRAKGRVGLEGGRLDLVGVGDWTGIELAAALQDGTLEVTRLEARRRGGKVSGRLTARDLWTAKRRFEGKLALVQVPISQGGSDLATLDLPGVALEGTLEDTRLDATVSVDSGTIRLPRKTSAALQSTAERKDIVEADLVAERARRRAPASGADEPAPPFEVRCRLVAKKLVIRAERPALNVDLHTDSTWKVAGDAVEVSGTIETDRGTVEPIAARVFHLERGRVSFPGGPVKAGALEIVARYDNPVAVVTVTIRGTVAKPALQFSSQPPLDDAKIAMLIATGRTEMNLNTNSVAPLTAQEASAAVVGAAMSAVFSGLVSDKLPVDQISFDTTRLYAGKYVTDALFVGYAYRFDAKAEEGENVNEVRAEYRLARRWRFELRYGDANVGDASIIWTTDY